MLNKLINYCSKWVMSILILFNKTTTPRRNYSKHFFTSPIRSFSSEALCNFSLEYLRNLRSDEIIFIYEKLPDDYKADGIIQAKVFRCHQHWPTDGDIPDTSPPLKINCFHCIVNKLPHRSSRIEKIIERHLYGLTEFTEFTDEEIKCFPLFYLIHNVKGEDLMRRWDDLQRKYRMNANLLLRLPCLDHNIGLKYSTTLPAYVYKYECFTCLNTE